MAAFLLLFHSMILLTDWLSWLGTILAQLFLWLVIYHVIRLHHSAGKQCNNDQSPCDAGNIVRSESVAWRWLVRSCGKMDLPIIVFGTALAVLSKESACIPLALVLAYYAMIPKPRSVLRGIVLAGLAVAVVGWMFTGPSQVFRTFGTSNSSAYSLDFIKHNYNWHLSSNNGMFTCGLPPYVLALLIAMIVCLRTKRIIPSSVVFVVLALAMKISFGYSNYIICGLLLIVMVLHWRCGIWYAMFACTFAPILPFYLSSNPYHLEAFSFLLVSVAVIFSKLVGQLRVPLAMQDIRAELGESIPMRCSAIKTRIHRTWWWKARVRSNAGFPMIVCGAILVGLFKENICILLTLTVAYYATLPKPRSVFCSVALAVLLATGVVALDRKSDGELFQTTKSDFVADAILAAASHVSIEARADVGQLGEDGQRLIVLLRHTGDDVRVSYSPSPVMGKYSQALNQTLRNIYGIKLGWRFDEKLARRALDTLTTNLLSDGGFEFTKCKSITYDSDAHAGASAMLIDKSDPKYQGITNVAPSVQTVNLKAGTYIFGGYYKLDGLEDGVSFEIVDTAGKQGWRSSVLSGATDWALRKGWFTVREDLTVLIRPGRIDNYVRGRVRTDDIYLTAIGVEKVTDTFPQSHR